MLEPLLDINQVAEILGVHRITAYEMAKRGELPSVRIGARGVRFRAVDVEEFIESQQRGRS